MSASERPGERIARAFHEKYEDLAPMFGYRTRAASAVPWEDVPVENRRLMIATVLSLLDDGVIANPPTREAYVNVHRPRSREALVLAALGSDERTVLEIQESIPLGMEPGGYRPSVDLVRGALERLLARGVVTRRKQRSARGHMAWHYKSTGRNDA